MLLTSKVQSITVDKFSNDQTILTLQNKLEGTNLLISARIESLVFQTMV